MYANAVARLSLNVPGPLAASLVVGVSPALQSLIRLQRRFQRLRVLVHASIDDDSTTRLDHGPSPSSPSPAALQTRPNVARAGARVIAARASTVSQRPFDDASHASRAVHRIILARSIERARRPPKRVRVADVTDADQRLGAHRSSRAISRASPRHRRRRARGRRDEGEGDGTREDARPHRARDAGAVVSATVRDMETRPPRATVKTTVDSRRLETSRASESVSRSRARASAMVFGVSATTMVVVLGAGALALEPRDVPLIAELGRATGRAVA